MPAEHVDGLADQPDVEIEADTRDMPGLLGAQNVARASDFQVLHGNCHPGAEFGVLRDGRQPVMRGLGQRCLWRVKEVRVPALTAAPDPATKLVELPQAEQVTALDDQRV